MEITIILFIIGLLIALNVAGHGKEKKRDTDAWIRNHRKSTWGGLD